MSIHILNDKKIFKGILNKFEGNSIMNDNTFIGCIKYKIESKNQIYINDFEIKKEYRGKGFGKEVFNELFKTYNTIGLSSVKKAIGFYFKIGAKDLGRGKGVLGDGDREMIITKQNFLDVTTGRKKPNGLGTFFDKPYNQNKDNFDDETSQLYKSVWNDNKLPLGTKLYKPTQKQINEYITSYGEYKGTIHSIIPNKNDFILAKKGLKVTRYSNIRYENSFDKLGLSKYDFAKKKFDGMIDGDTIEIF